MEFGYARVNWLDRQSQIIEYFRVIRKPNIRMITVFAVLADFAVPAASYAQTTTTTVSATCKDGSAFTGKSRSGACRGHGGVQSWDAAAAASAAPTATTPAPTTSPAVQPPPRAAVGGSGQVWVNPTSKVYHCPGSRYYGKTKTGSYMSEAAAKAAGDRPSGGKACAS
jgi:hypothetical protein